MKTIGLMVNSYKGYKFLELALKHYKIEWVASYIIQYGILFDSYQSIKGICKEHKVPFVEKENIDFNVDIVFAVGWQYMINHIRDNCVVMHDSLLPKYRGFSPTVTAFINGENELGVTALKPSEKIDEGKILWQSGIKVTDEVTIKEIYNVLAQNYFDCFKNILMDKTYERKIYAQTTYSIWRDYEDYFVDWSQGASKIRRFINAVGFPYLGAKTRFGQFVYEIIRFVNFDCEYHFENPIPGKVFQKRGKEVDVICGDGIITVELNKELPKLRCRLI